MLRPLRRNSGDQISLKTEKVAKTPTPDEKTTEPTISDTKTKDLAKSIEPKVVYEPRKFIKPPLEPPTVAKNHPLELPVTMKNPLLEPPMIVKNPPFFARKSAPKPIEYSESKSGTL